MVYLFFLELLIYFVKHNVHGVYQNCVHHKAMVQSNNILHHNRIGIERVVHEDTEAELAVTQGTWQVSTSLGGHLLFSPLHGGECSYTITGYDFDLYKT